MIEDLDMSNFTIDDCEIHIHDREQNIKVWKNLIENKNIKAWKNLIENTKNDVDELENEIIELKEKLNELEDLETTSMEEKAGIGGIDG